MAGTGIMTGMGTGTE